MRGVVVFVVSRWTVVKEINPFLMVKQLIDRAIVSRVLSASFLCFEIEKDEAKVLCFIMSFSCALFVTSGMLLNQVFVGHLILVFSVHNALKLNQYWELQSACCKQHFEH